MSIFNVQRFLVPLFMFIWRSRLNSQTQKINVVKVKGWRTALVDRVGYGREKITFCFWWFD